MERDLNNREFEQFHDLIYGIAGIHYRPNKVELLSNRIRTRLKATGEVRYDSYLQRIARPDQQAEKQAFLDAITTNESYFFRCQAHWDHFREWLEKQHAETDLRRAGLRLWSAAASNGAEACTMLIVLHQVLGDDFGGVPIDILGTDLSATILAAARHGTFRPYALTQVPAPLLARYFTRDQNTGNYRFDPDLLQKVRFQQHNLMTPTPRGRAFDAVFLRNVMIYFDTASREHVLRQTLDAMRPGGLLIVGESESLISAKHDFEYIKPSIFTRRTGKASTTSASRG